mmetsp:Transcript_41340/g.127763  ORF Transcript_41340/g.127763 Transcript_41340/m.127763 type:complete len:228 (-) Transcript_41340:433-1116(-)
MTRLMISDSTDTMQLHRISSGSCRDAPDVCASWIVRDVARTMRASTLLIVSCSCTDSGGGKSCSRRTSFPCSHGHGTPQWMNSAGLARSRMIDASALMAADCALRRNSMFAGSDSNRPRASVVAAMASEMSFERMASATLGPTLATSMEPRNRRWMRSAASIAFLRTMHGIASLVTTVSTYGPMASAKSRVPTLARAVSARHLRSESPLARSTLTVCVVSVSSSCPS